MDFRALTIIMPNKPESTKKREDAGSLPRDVFLYLLAIVSLIVSAVSLGIVLFQYISIYFPDLISDPYFSRSAYYSTIRSSLAALLVIFPVYIWVSWFLKRDTVRFPEKRELKIRKWLLYLTIFIAALVIIGDLVVLIQNLLEGERSLRFLLKILSIFFIAGSIFGHYFYELREKTKNYVFVRFYSWLVVIIVAFFSVAGFWIVGSPANQRVVRFDERRVNDLQIIQNEAINYWQRKGKLPASLTDLKNDISGFVSPSDPETGEAYGYTVSGDLKFQLCAQFGAPDVNSPDNSVPAARLKSAPVPYGVAGEMNSNWQHGAGKVCFDRVIDPDFYPPIITPLDKNLKK